MAREFLRDRSLVFLFFSVDLNFVFLLDMGGSAGFKSFALTFYLSRRRALLSRVWSEVRSGDCDEARDASYYPSATFSPPFSGIVVSRTSGSLSNCSV